MNKRKILIWFLMASSFALFCVALVKNEYFNWRYQLIMLFAALALSMFILLVSKKAWPRVLGSVFLIVVAGVLMYSQYSLGTIMNPKDTETISYQLYRLQNANSDVEALRFGELGQSQSRDEYIMNAYAENGFLEPQITYYNSVGALVSALLEGYVDAIWVDSRFSSEIAAQHPSFASHTTVLASYTTEVLRPDIARPVNILKDAYIVYVSGIDVYGSTNTRSRSDLNLLLVINPKTQNVTTVSLPRDSYVGLSCRDNAMDKLTHAALYGVDCSVQTLENLLNIKVNYYIRVNFTSLETVVDALGGVEVYSQYAFSTDSGFTFKEGINTVVGEAAVAFARERIHIPYGDVSRGRNHQALLEGILKKMMDPSVISRIPTLMPQLLNVLDTNYGYNNFAEFVSHQIDNKKEWSFERLDLKGTGDMQFTYSQGSTYKYYVYWPDPASLGEIRSAIETTLLGDLD